MECERTILNHFRWNLNFVLPINFVRLHLAQGILFSNELKPYKDKLPLDDYNLLKQELSRALTSEALSLSDIISAKGACFLRETDPSNIAASIIYFARKNILLSEEVSKLVKVPSLWPEELIIMTRCTKHQIYQTLETPIAPSQSKQNNKSASNSPDSAHLAVN